MLVAVQSKLGVNSKAAGCFYLDVFMVVAFFHLVERGCSATTEFQESGGDGTNIEVNMILSMGIANNIIKDIHPTFQEEDAAYLETRHRWRFFWLTAFAVN